MLAPGNFQKPGLLKKPGFYSDTRKEKAMWFSSLMRNSKRSGLVERRRSHGSPGKRFSFRPQLEALEDRWMPSSILTVTNAGDWVAGSLRNEIAAAWNGDTIVFDPSLKGQTIFLQPVTGDSPSQISIGKSLNIEGLGAANLAISGDHAMRVFYVDGGVQVTISGLTIENGNGYNGSFGIGFGDDGRGGALINYGTLTLSNCTVSGNSAYYYGGGIYNAGTMTISGCTVTKNSVLEGPVQGGGIFNAGTMTILSSTVTGNSTTVGGGIYNAGTLTILSSTVTGNSAYSGAGIYNDVSGNLTIASKSLVCNNFDFRGAEDDLLNFGTVKISMSKVCKFSGNK
jgi:predicted outer membrane repeat protein